MACQSILLFSWFLLVSCIVANDVFVGRLIDCALKDSLLDGWLGGVGGGGVVVAVLISEKGCN